ncbi:lipid-A-disaccharide synthase [Oleiphilus sp. HI0071]|nr:lipid-A-disaccharide synthase [Oleiphilus sp. HI0080]KZY61970.1 lipid-A-disaccharide synthase [Oleiphilus sp. HI0065]KZY82414.1 lipid-A-disaccharide synthase [Oleiphilus sp. HI0071]KZY96592.1 lipid-A-disaccharide synthase [Oleiphilus sp. HI0073]KZZ40548.1 lipid-A-disaccharide synthase [Oleiphilus sp. HI0118]KZZ52271.1 lipid-A-disaccharide synthase [Oleiphilus sp. HI0122]KZZ76597.1 lipid-A-disaccharide synthase [Oleiphilus sp. HI0130]KZZ78708.1 lipid-A-disaccharide synthase [Oleiphilus sp.
MPVDAVSEVDYRPIHIGIVVGEVSGDILGSGLMSEILKRHPNATFSGIGGPLMLEQGFETLFPMERLSVMGLFEVLGRIFELIGIRRALKRHFVEKRPDVFIGIDAPDFNIGLELQLRQAGIKTAHYVSPSVWAWRQKRVFKIARAVDLMLTLFPFEAKFYKQHRVSVRFVGHPLADLIPISSDRSKARANLGLTEAGPIVAILPGSRAGEISRIAESFFGAAEQIKNKSPNVRFVIPCVNANRRAQVLEILERFPALEVELIDGRSREVMAASNVVLLASGTATLECMLMKRPMVVAYRLNKLTYWVMQRLIKTPYVALPNLLAGKELVPELLQDDATVSNISAAVLERLPVSMEKSLQSDFSLLHESLKKNASSEAAEAVLALANKS